MFVSSATGGFFANIKLYRVEGLENYFCLRERLSRGELPCLSSQIDPPTAMAEMRKLVSLLAKMSQGERNLILFLAGRVFKKQGGMKAGRKLASSASP